MRILFMTAVLAFSLGCGDKKKAPDEEQAEGAKAAACESNQDCAQGFVCLAGECADTRSKAIVTDPGNAITPDKVKNELDQVNEEREKKAGEMMDL